MAGINVALVGLGFGGAFLPIYLDHPHIGLVGIYDPDSRKMAEFSSRFKVDRLYGSFAEILEDKNLDAVHLVTPIPLHAEQTVAVLRSGKHCACTVPMATSLTEIKAIQAAVQQSGKTYMMMETVLFTRHFFHVQEMLLRGELGDIQFMRGAHYQDMTGWPDYWQGLPPMWYGTHAIAPFVALAGSRISKVHCFGSGKMAQSLSGQYDNPFPIESALFKLENGLAAEATRSLFATARVYQEGLHVLGSKASFEWGFAENDPPYVTWLDEEIPKDQPGKRGLGTRYEQVELANYHARLPEEIQKYTVGKDYDATNPQESLQKGASSGHHGSHPHLVHEFISSIIEDRDPLVDFQMSANITAAGICAHESALKDGAAVYLPDFS